MPPRWLSVLIVAAWLSLTGWLFYAELLPRLLPGQPPPVSIDLVEEAHVRRAPVTWDAYQDDKLVGQAETRIEHPSRGEFAMTCRLTQPSRLPLQLAVGPLEVKALSSAYHVSADG